MWVRFIRWAWIVHGSIAQFAVTTFQASQVQQKTEFLAEDVPNKSHPSSQLEFGHSFVVLFLTHTYTRAYRTTQKAHCQQYELLYCKRNSNNCVFTLFILHWLKFTLHFLSNVKRKMKERKWKKKKNNKMNSGFFLAGVFFFSGWQRQHTHILRYFPHKIQSYNF